LPRVADSFFQMLASVFVAQPVVAPASPCQVGVSITGAVSQSVAQIGDTVTFTYTVTNLGTAPLTTVQAAAQLPGGLSVANAGANSAYVKIEARLPGARNTANASGSSSFTGTDLQVASSGAPSEMKLVSATDPGGTVDPATGYIGWVVDGGVGGGATTTLSMSTTVSEFGQWTPTVCVVGLDPAGDMVYDCEHVTVVTVAPTLTPTPSPTASVTPTGTALVAPARAGTPTPATTSTAAPTSRPRLNNPPPVPTSTPVPTRTPGSSGTPPLTSTPAPTATTIPGPTNSPEVTSTPVPTRTPQATSTPETTNTPKPTEVPHPTDTPRPTETHD
jgi:uncharacterized repeat protein (TIGR01451 family)